MHLLQIGGTQIVKVNACLGQISLDGFLGRKTGFIASDGNFHVRILSFPYFKLSAFFAVATMFSTVRPMVSRR